MTRLLRNSFKNTNIRRKIQKIKIKKQIEYSFKKNNYPVNLDKKNDWKNKNNKLFPFLL